MFHLHCYSDVKSFFKMRKWWYIWEKLVDNFNQNYTKRSLASVYLFFWNNFSFSLVWRKKQVLLQSKSMFTLLRVKIYSVRKHVYCPSDEICGLTSIQGLSDPLMSDTLTNLCLCEVPTILLQNTLNITSITSSLC